MKLEGEIVYDENDDDNKRGSDSEVPTLRASVGKADAGPSEGVPELQTDEVGRAQPLGRGYVYFFETEDSQYIKIGFSVNVSQRMGQIGTLVPMRMIGYFPGSRETESWLHQRFAGQWHTGEWFKSSDELRQFVQMMGLLTAPPEPAPLRETVYKAQPKGEPNPAAVALAKRRMETMTSHERREVARKGGTASKAKLTPEQRSAIARKAGLAGGRGRKKAK